jgi:hypothetical protein
MTAGRSVTSPRAAERMKRFTSALTPRAAPTVAGWHLCPGRERIRTPCARTEKGLAASAWNGYKMARSRPQTLTVSSLSSFHQRCPRELHTLARLGSSSPSIEMSPSSTAASSPASSAPSSTTYNAKQPAESSFDLSTSRLLLAHLGAALALFLATTDAVRVLPLLCDVRVLIASRRQLCPPVSPLSRRTCARLRAIAPGSWCRISLPKPCVSAYWPPRCSETSPGFATSVRTPSRPCWPQEPLPCRHRDLRGRICTLWCSEGTALSLSTSAGGAR